MFYAYKDALDGNDMPMMGGIVIGCVFGAIHCIAWSF
jgi:hypothetical protein